MKKILLLSLSLPLFLNAATTPAPATPAAAPAEPVAAPPVAVTPPQAPQENAPYDRRQFYGVPVMDASGKLQYVDENPLQTHAKDQFVMVKVKNFTVRKKEVGRVRVAIWDRAEIYGKEGVKPWRASSHWAKDAPSGEMVFKIGGFEKGKKYAFFAHFDKNDDGKLNRILGIPTEPFIFSNAANQGKGPGLSREGLSAPKFESTLITYTGPGQEIELSF